MTAAAAMVLTGCGVPDPEPTPSTLQVTMPGDTPPAARPPADAGTTAPSAAPSGTSSPASAAAGPEGAARSPWWPGAARVTARFGCSAAPDLSPDPRCPGGQGYHHGVDVALPCGTIVTAGVAGTVVGSDRPGAPGPAYGPHPLRLRTADGRRDVILGHARRTVASPGQTVTPGTPLVESGDLGAPQGCHLHVEVRAAGGPVTSAVDPLPWLHLAR